MQIHRIISQIIEIRLRACSAQLNRRRALTCQLHSTQNLINITANQSINNRHDFDDVASTQFAKTRRDKKNEAIFSPHTRLRLQKRRRQPRNVFIWGRILFIFKAIPWSNPIPTTSSHRCCLRLSILISLQPCFDKRKTARKSVTNTNHALVWICERNRRCLMTNPTWQVASDVKVIRKAR